MGKAGQVTCWQAGEGEETEAGGGGWSSPKVPQPETATPGGSRAGPSGAGQCCPVERKGFMPTHPLALPVGSPSV